MKTLFAFLTSSLLAANATAQPVRLHIFTAPDDGGFVTAESSARQNVLKDVAKKLSKEKKDIALADDAAVTLEILSYAVIRGTAVERVRTTIGNQNFEIYQTQLKAILKFGEHTKEFDVQTSSAGNSPDVETMLTYQVKAFVKDNAAKLK